MRHERTIVSSQPVSDPKVGPLGDWGTLPQHSSGNPLLPEGCEGVRSELLSFPGCPGPSQGHTGLRPEQGRLAVPGRQGLPVSVCDGPGLAAEGSAAPPGPK